MCMGGQPKMPEMPPPPKPLPPAPAPIKPEAPPPPPEMAKQEVPTIKGPETAKSAQKQARQGTTALTIPLNTGSPSAGPAPTGLNIPT